jgi:sec-independent protein translocase protein TatA
MNIFGIGLPEMAVIMVIALLVFGPKKLPEIGRTLAKTLQGFQQASKEFENEFKKEAARIEKTVVEPMKATLEKSETKAIASQPATEPATEPVTVASAEEVNLEGDGIDSQAIGSDISDATAPETTPATDAPVA